MSDDRVIWDREVVVASDGLRVILRRSDGAIVGVSSTQTGWTLIDDEALGLGFSLMLPLPGRRTNLVLSSEQESPVWSDIDGGVRATWPVIRSQHGGLHDISVEVEVRAVGEAVTFDMRIANRDQVTVEEVRFPWVGHVAPTGAGGPIWNTAPVYGSLNRRSVWPTFENVPGYFGLSRPTQVTEGPGNLTAPGTPFILVEDGNEGLYIGLGGAPDATVGWMAELHPGWGDSLLQAVPASDLGAPEPTAVQVGAAHLPYVTPGDQRWLTTVALAAYVGDWHRGVDVYRSLSGTWQGPRARPAAWAAEPTAWLQLQMNAPDDDLRLTFADLPEVARRCAANGVGVIQLVGWNDGGQDRNNPSHDPDQRLGGPDGLREAIAACHAHGVKVVLFTKYTWSDRSTERYRSELRRLAIGDPYGDPYVYGGYRYQTVAQLWDVNTRRLVPMCFAAEDYLDVCVDETRKVIDSGADGMLFDECLHHMPAILCFDESHGHRRAEPVYRHDNELVRRFRAMEGLPDGFLFAGEACYDEQFEQYECSYFRTDDRDHTPFTRYLFPDVQLMTALTGFDDRNMVDQCLLYRYVISYEPYFFKGSLDDTPMTVAYGNRMDALRLEWREWFWDGTFRDTVGVTAVDAKDGTPVRCSRFESAVDRSSAVAVMNDHPSNEVVVNITVTDGEDASYRWRLVDDERWSDGAAVVLPPRSAAIVVPAHRVH